MATPAFLSVATRRIGLGLCTPGNIRTSLNIGGQLQRSKRRYGRQFLCGNDLGIADIAVAVQIRALDVPLTPVSRAKFVNEPTLCAG